MMIAELWKNIGAKELSVKLVTNTRLTQKNSGSQMVSKIGISFVVKIALSSYFSDSKKSSTRRIQECTIKSTYLSWQYLSDVLISDILFWI